MELFILILPSLILIIFFLLFLNPDNKQPKSNIKDDTIPLKKLEINLPELKNYDITKLWHMTHIDNLSNIQKHGLISYYKSRKLGLLKFDISNPGVQNHRNRKEPIYNNSIHSYVPLYFNPRNPMLYVRKNLQSFIIILEFNANSIFQYDKVIFTDGNAASQNTKFYSSISDLKYLDWLCLNAMSYWNDFIDGKRKRCAEILVPNKIPLNEVCKIICYNSYSSNNVKKVLNDNIEVQINEKHYF